MPMDCPFHPKRDLLWWPETDAEEEFDDELSFQWTCPLCGSIFLCAERLAIHWDESHRFDLNQVIFQLICIRLYLLKIL